MLTAHDIEAAMARWAPKELAASWDNVGLLVGSGDAPVSKVLVSLDITQEVAEEAADLGAQLIVSHHPVMNVTWYKQEMQTLRSDTRLGKLLTTMVRHGLSAICMHTNLDAAKGGVNDVLASRLGLQNLEPLDADSGIGRIGTLMTPLPLPEFLVLVKSRLQPNGIRYADCGKTVQRVAVGGGACADMAGLAAMKGCDAIVTSDAKYNQFLDAVPMGIHLIDAGHFPTEDVICPEIIRRLRDEFPGLEISKSSSHREIIQYYV